MVLNDFFFFSFFIYESLCCHASKMRKRKSDSIVLLVLEKVMLARIPVTSFCDVRKSSNGNSGPEAGFKQNRLLLSFVVIDQK